MNAKIEALKNIGCETKQTLERFLDDEEFWIECVNDVLEDESFEKLGIELENKNASAAFDLAHTLKGIIANTGLTPMYDIVVNIVEPLRRGSMDNLDGYYKQLIEKREEIKELMK